MSVQIGATDYVQLPADSSGKKTGFYTATVGGGATAYIPTSLIVDESGRSADLAAAVLAGTERGLVTRSIASGDVAAGSADAGTWPVKVGARVESTSPAPALTDENRSDLLVDGRGSLRIVVATSTGFIMSTANYSVDGLATTNTGLGVNANLWALDDSAGTLTRIRCNAASGLYVQTKSEVATATDAGAAPSSYKAVAGYDRDSLVARAMSVDYNGRVNVAPDATVERLDTLIEGIAYVIDTLAVVGRPRSVTPSVEAWLDKVLDR